MNYIYLMESNKFLHSFNKSKEFCDRNRNRRINKSKLNYVKRINNQKISIDAIPVTLFVSSSTKSNKIYI